MQQFGTGNKIKGEDRTILESAEILLNPDQPDRFDMNKLAHISGVDRKLILARFPFPELLALGVVTMIWQARLDHIHGSENQRLGWPNGQDLMVSDWVPDPELLTHFSDHPLVKIYLLGEPPLRSWFRISGEVC